MTLTLVITGNNDKALHDAMIKILPHPVNPLIIRHEAT